MNKRMDIRRLCLLGVLTALVFAGNFARIVMPIAVGGTTAFTLGNIMCVLSGLLMGPVGCLASGIGAALYDLTNPLYISEVPFTFLNKLVMGLVAGLIAHWGENGGEIRALPDSCGGGVCGLLCALFPQELLLQRPFPPGPAQSDGLGGAAG